MICQQLHLGVKGCAKVFDCDAVNRAVVGAVIQLIVHEYAAVARRDAGTDLHGTGQ